MANLNAAVYSFKDLSIVLSHPIAGTFRGQGQQGFGQVTFVKTTTRAEQSVSADGLVLTSIVAGDGGTITIEVQQTSPLHAFLIGWSNDVDAAANLGDVSNAVAGIVSAQALSAKASHYATGVTPQKQPDKPYGAQSAMVTWTLVCANLVNE